jgi:hypothetical protein
MKIHEKALLYDELLKDYTALLEELDKFKAELEEIPKREDLLVEKEKSLSNYYAMTTGAFSAMAFGLDIKLHKFRGVLKWYTNKN